MNSEPYHIGIEKNAVSVVPPLRRVSISLLGNSKNSLDELSSNNIIEKVEGPSDWLNALVFVEKPSGKFRICSDLKNSNKVLKRMYCHIPTQDQIQCDMAEATVFSELLIETFFALKRVFKYFYLMVSHNDVLVGPGSVLKLLFTASQRYDIYHIIIRALPNIFLKK